MEKCNLSASDISRYSRQLIMNDFGPKGQSKLLNSKVLLIGAGGLGCPSALYLTAAGVGVLGMIDFDVVEISNLHRQVAHSESTVDVYKVVSLAQKCSALNSSTKIDCYPFFLTRYNAVDIISKYDVILDCSDNVATRYLVNDACILAKKPLISGSALQQEGQLTVYGFAGGPCYRCIFPKPPPPESVTNCSDGGVLGVVPGIVGTMQAGEAIKIITGCGSVLSQKLLLYDYSSGSSRIVKLRGRRTDCPLCGDCPSIAQPIDYIEFCGAAPDDKDHNIEVLNSSERITVHELKENFSSTNRKCLVVDVRSEVENEICRLDETLNVPINDILYKTGAYLTLLEEIEKFDSVIMLCRRGNDSQKAVRHMMKSTDIKNVIFKDVIGGLYAWSKTH